MKYRACLRNRVYLGYPDVNAGFKILEQLQLCYSCSLLHIEANSVHNYPIVLHFLGFLSVIKL